MIIEESAKEKMLCLVNENSNSFKNKEEEEETSNENELGNSTISNHSHKDEDTQKGTSSLSTKEKSIESPSSVKFLKAKASTKTEKKASIDGSTEESEETNEE